MPLLTLLAVALASPTPVGGSPPPDIKAIIPPDPYYVAANPWFLVVALGSILLAALVAWFLIFRKERPKTVPAVSPRDLAKQRLDALAARAGTLDPRTFGNEVADVLRVYIGAQFHLRPDRQTSAEFLGSVAGSRSFTLAEHALLTEFLEGCDLLKFARADATAEGKHALLTQANAFVQSSSPPDLPDPAR